jgi:scyllo-inositol 2-dehydrogenase (NADP+)
MQEITVGLVGYGLGGSVFHAPLIGAIPELRLSTIVTSRSDRVAQDLPGVRVSATVAELISDPAIDLVVVSSPSPTHFEIARAALRAGKHVVVDKPFATSVREADELIAIAEANNRMVSVFQNRRWDNDFLTVKKCVADGLLGNVYHYEAHFDRFRPQLKGGWREEPAKGGGLLYDLGSHLIDQALQLFGTPHAVLADIFSQRAGAMAEDYFHLVLDYGHRRAILHAANVVREPGPHFLVHGDNGSFLKYGLDSQEASLKAGMRPGDPLYGLDDPANYGQLTAADGSREVVQTLRGGYQEYYAGIAAHLQRGAPVPVNARDSRDGLAIIEAARRSAVERRTIAVL